MELKASKSSKNADDILGSMKLLRNEARELYLPKQVPVISEIPEPFTFYRNWVAPNIPVLIKGAIKNWDAVKKWNKEYLCEKLENKKFSVAVTPNGYADAIHETVIDGQRREMFVLPDERLMTLSEFYAELDAAAAVSDASSSKGVFYIQRQNSNLTEEFPELLSDIDADLQWATEIFQSKPEAINLWIGDRRAVSSLHKDPFENIYCVVSGHKDFILLPPTDRPWLPYKVLPVGQFKETSPGKFEVHKANNQVCSYSRISQAEIYCDESDTEVYKVPWIAVDPINPDYKKYPLYKFASPLKIRVAEGDALYLPSLWFHYVEQSHKCIAINYWFDMNLDIKYAYFQLVEKLSTRLEKQVE